MLVSQSAVGFFVIPEEFVDLKAVTFSRYESFGIPKHLKFLKLHTSTTNVQQWFIQTVDILDLVPVIHFWA